MAIEIERKYLVQSDVFKADASGGLDILEQAFRIQITINIYL